jgi:TonB family protein
MLWRSGGEERSGLRPYDQGNVFTPGKGGVTAPRPIYDPDPEYSDAARRAKYQSSVLLWLVVAPNGRPRNIRVQRSLGMGLDEKAIEAVSPMAVSAGHAKRPTRRGADQRGSQRPVILTQVGH